MKLNKYILFPIFLIVFVDNFGYSLAFNLIGALLLKPEYGMMAASTSVIVKNGMLALTFAIFPLMQFFTAPIIGEIADIYGRKKAFYLSLLGMILGFLLSAWATALGSIWFLFFSRLITGVFAGNISICMASIADLSENEKVRGKNFSMVTALFGISWVLAMVVGGYIGNPALTGRLGPSYVFLFTAALAFLNFLLILVMYKDTAPRHEEQKFCFSQGLINIKETLMLKSARMFFAIYFLWSLGWVMAVQWYPAYAIEVFNASVVSFTSWFILMGVTWTLGAFFARNYLFNKYSSTVIAIFGFASMTACLILMQFMGIFVLFSIFFAIGSFFSVFSMSSSLNLISMSAPAEVQGKIMGLSQSAQSIAFVLVSVVAFLVSLATISLLYYFAAGISALALILLLFKSSKDKLASK